MDDYFNFVDFRADRGRFNWSLGGTLLGNLKVREHLRAPLFLETVPSIFEFQRCRKLS